MSKTSARGRLGITSCPPNRPYCSLPARLVGRPAPAIALLLLVLDVLVEPRRPPRPQVEQGLPGDGAVILIGIQVERSRLAKAVERVVEPNRVGRIGADVLVAKVVVHQQRAGQVV